LLIVTLEPLPETAPGFTVQVPEGRPLRTILPVATVQVGCVIAPAVGGAGTGGWALITTFAEAGDIQPAALVTVKLYVPVAKPVIVLLVPVPVIDPGLIVHVPEAGKPLSTTLPVETVQLGWVMVPTTGAVGVAGWVLIIILAEAAEVHPTALVTV